MAEEKVHLELFREKLDSFTPTVDNLRRMFGTARHALNRNSLPDLQELSKIRDVVDHEIKTAIGEIQTSLPGKSESERADLRRVHGILSHLEIIFENIGGMAQTIRKKINDGIIFTDKDFSQINNLFTHQAGTMRTLVDIFKTDNEILKRYLDEESLQQIQICFNAATKHEARLIEGLCMPQASPIILAILDHMRVIWRHILGIIKLLSN